MSWNWFRLRILVFAAVCVFLVTAGSACVTPAGTSPAIPATLPDRPAQEIESADAQFVFRVYDQLQGNFFNPSALNHVRLFNAALDGLAVELGRQAIEFQPLPIGDNISLAEAKQHFAAEFQRAVDASRHVAGMDNNALAFSAASALLDAVGDSHTYFIPPAAANENYSGIGARIERLEANFYYLDTVFSGSPAEQAGLRRFDRLVAVNGREINDNISEIVAQIRGLAGTTVELTIERGEARRQFTVRRGNIQRPAGELRVLNDGDRSYIYIRLYTFMTSSQSLIVVEQFIKDHQDADGIILDLRGNGGGHLSLMLETVQMFLDNNAPVLIARYREGRRVRYVTSQDALTHLPLTVLIDGGSASASEITAIALQENHRATIVGVQSMGAVGMGIVISLLPYDAEMLVTIAQVFSPSGRPMEGDGVHPDVEVALTRENISEGQDTQLLRAIEALQQDPR